MAVIASGTVLRWSLEVRRISREGREEEWSQKQHQLMQRCGLIQGMYSYLQCYCGAHCVHPLMFSCCTRLRTLCTCPAAQDVTWPAMCATPCSAPSACLIIMRAMSPTSCVAFLICEQEPRVTTRCANCGATCPCQMLRYSRLPVMTYQVDKTHNGAGAP